jgi:predicted component of type VI protein secretion system
MSTRLVPLTESLAPTVQLHRPVLLIGRHPDCDVRIELPQISRRHCCIALAYDRFVIRDLGSTNGVRVNGRVVDEAHLQAGDEVAIAQIIYRFEDDAPAPAPAAPSASKSSKPSTALVAKADERPLTLPNLGDEDDLVPLDDSVF